MAKLYLDNGYLDISYLDSKALPFNIVVGGRGIGKTYGLLRYYMERKEFICYMRRSAVQAKAASTAAFNPYRKICDDLGFDVEFSKETPKTIYNSSTGQALAVVTPLSTFANIRGLDGSGISAIVYDEFIPERDDGRLKDEGEALLNAYETLNRNRELEGMPPVKLWMLSNSNRIESAIFAELGIMKTMLDMERKGQTRLVIPERGLQLVHIHDSPISDAKSETALYKLVNTSYKEMALNNAYRHASDNLKPRDLSAYTPKVCLGELCIYVHKATKRLYVSTHVSGSPKRYGTGDSEIHRFLRNYGYVRDDYLLGYVDFEDIDCEYIFKTLLDM